MPPAEATRRAVRGACLALLALLPLLPGCGTMGYYAQAIHGQCQILHRKQPIRDLLDDPKTPPELKERLRMVLRIRQFAEAELGLPANGQYREYADLGRRFAVWSVYAAPEFSLDAKAWWYPVVGRLEYQGYFNEARARRFAEKLQREGFDVHLGGVEAYSTLGWFHDPVLNTFLQYNDDTDLADLLFHELAHQRLFVGGDTDFNEAFATAVADEGVERWLRVHGDAAELARHREATERRQQFLALVSGARARLERLYASMGPAPCRACACHRPGEACDCPEWRREKALVFEQLRRDYAEAKTRWGGNAEYDGWFNQPLNNALLNTVDTYYALVPAFRRMLQGDGGDLAKFYKQAEALGKLKKSERQRRLRELAEAANTDREAVTAADASDSTRPAP